MIIIEPPDGFAQIAISPLVSSRKSAADAWATEQLAAHMAANPPPPPDPAAYSTPPPLRVAPPMLRRQNASRFSWPPDAHQEWTYIAMSPQQIVEQAARLLGEHITVEQVCSFFRRRAGDSRAYHAYSTRWSQQLEEVLR